MGPPEEFIHFLLKHGLAGHDEPANWRLLSGGVSSDIWSVDLPGRAICLKRALSKLKVSEDWRAPLSRSDYEWAWIQFVAQHYPHNVPTPIAHDAEHRILATEFLPPEKYPVWKVQLLTGQVSIKVARAVGSLVGKIHSTSAGETELADRFDTITNFRALRLDPYLLTLATKYSAYAQIFDGLIERTVAKRLVLIHGDVSPKNILVGPRGPILLDAECAWFGDPAFDIAFCLNHLLLKCLVRPRERNKLLRSFNAFTEAYFNEVNWEARPLLEERAATLLPALMLARIDGKSPVEYLVEERDKETVRRVALSLLAKPSLTLSQVASSHISALKMT
jgi:5-methylthioribose kinase